MTIPIPAIDIIDGKCVRLTKGAYSEKKIYDFDPLEIAHAVVGAGLPRLHLVDLDGARSGRVVNHKVLEKIASKTPLIIDFGGGIKTEESLRIAFESGAAQVVIGSTAVKDKDLFLQWIGSHGADKFILGADVRENMIAISGWEETTAIHIDEFLNDYQKKGIRYVLCTDIERDGMLEGTALELYDRLSHEFPKLAFIASGGVTSLQELDALRAMNAYGAVIGKALFEHRLNIEDLAGWYHNQVRG